MHLPTRRLGYALISRSKLATDGITVKGSLINSDYKGPVLYVLHNHMQLDTAYATY